MIECHTVQTRELALIIVIIGHEKMFKVRLCVCDVIWCTQKCHYVKQEETTEWEGPLKHVWSPGICMHGVVRYEFSFFFLQLFFYCIYWLVVFVVFSFLSPFCFWSQILSTTNIYIYVVVSCDITWHLTCSNENKIQRNNCIILFGFKFFLFEFCYALTRAVLFRYGFCWK